MKKRLLIIPSVFLLVIALAGCKGTVITPPTAAAASGSGTGTASSVQVTLGAASIANGGSTSVTATVLDGSGGPVSGVNVSFSVISSATGSLSPSLVTTNASGVASTTFTATAANTTATIRASVTVGATSINGTAPITIGIPVPVATNVIVSLGSTTIGNGGSTAVSATVSGASGPISGATVTFTVNPPGAGTFAQSVVTTVGGVAATTFTAVSSDTVVTILGTVAALNNSAQLTIGAPAPPVPASMTLNISPLTLNINAQASLVATVKDASGNAAYNNLVTFLITGGTGSGSFATLPTVVSAVSVTTDSLGTATAVFNAGSISGQVNFSVSVPPGTGALTKTGSVIITSNPDSVDLSVASGSLVNGQNTNVTASVLNILGQPVSDGTQVSFTLTYAGAAPGALSSATAFTVGGLARVVFTADQTSTGPAFITAAAGTPAVTSNQVLVNVSPAMPGSIQFVSAVPDAIAIGSGNTSLVKFRVLSSTGGPSPTTTVNFEMLGPSGADVTATGTTDNAGEVTTILQAGNLAGPVVVKATVQGTTLSATAGNISIGGGIPSDRFLSVSASKLNLPGLGCDGQTSIINVYLADRFGNYNILQGWSVSFATDAGAIDRSNVTDAAGATTASYRTQAPRPNDVDPIAGEPYYTALVSGVTRTFNPRDGYAGILVYTSGEEYFDDKNADADYQPGEPFTDLPEPFIDSNDSGVWNSGELFFDWPLSVPTSTVGSYNAGNGVWDRQIPIFRNIPLVITGPPDFSPVTTHIVSGPSLTTGDVSIAKGSSVTFYIFVSDVNMNAPMAGTTVTMTADDSSYSVTKAGGYSILPDSLSYGPAYVSYTVRNKSTVTVATPINVSYSVLWPGPRVAEEA